MAPIGTLRNIAGRVFNFLKAWFKMDAKDDKYGNFFSRFIGCKQIQ